jgi:cytochrome c oxidase subunit III
MATTASEVAVRDGFTEHAEHFADASAERRAAQLGMWLFLVQEVLLFGGLFCAFTLYRTLFVDTFRYLAAVHLDWVLGTVNTVVLLGSSFTVAAGVHFARARKSGHVAWAYALSIALAGVFLVVKYFEYSHKVHEGLLPGPYFHHDLEPLKAVPGVDLQRVGPGAPMFFVLYFFITGLHGLHVVIGMGLLGWVAFRAARGEFARRRDTVVELTGMYWHLVDLVWIFVYPLLYLL